MDYINKYLAARVGSSKKTVASHDIKAKKPLFHAQLFRFAGGYACCYFGVSHALVDGRAYYQIIEQVSSFMNEGVIKKRINWGNPKLTTLELWHDHYTKKDVKKSGILPLLLGFLRSGKRAKQHLWILDQEEISELKKDLLDPAAVEFLSSHDVIISAVCKVIQSSDEISVLMDYRERSPSFDMYDGGNCLKSWFLPCSVGADPNEIRKAVNKGYYYESGQFSGKAVRQGRVCYTSSWVKCYKSIQGVDTICHFPSAHFVGSMPADTGILFPVDGSNLALLNNFRKVDSAELAKMPWIKTG